MPHLAYSSELRIREPIHVQASTSIRLVYRANILPGSAPRAAPQPCSTVPFRRDSDFVDRGDLLSRVDERCSQPASRAALVGLGGAGKSQLAIEHAYRTRDKSPDTWVFWVYASNTARFEESFRDIADIAKIAGRGDANLKYIQART